MQIEIDRQTEKLLEELGATDPASRGAVIREALLRTLEAREVENLGLSEEERERIGRKLVEDAGACRELTDADWERIIHGPITEEELDRPFGKAVPPEWEGRTPRELRRAAKEGLT